MTVLFYLFFTLLSAACGQTLTFVQKPIILSIPSDFPVGAAIYRIVAIDDITGERSQDAHFEVLETTTFPPSSTKSFSSLRPSSRRDGSSSGSHFVVDGQTGTIMASPHRPVPLSAFIGYTYALKITATTNRASETMIIVIAIANQTKDFNCVPKEAACFGSSEYTFVLPESVKVYTKIATFRPITHSHVCSHFYNTYHLDNEDEAPISVHNPSGEITVTKHLDFEDRQEYELNVSCTSTYDEGPTMAKTFTRAVTIVVKDLNDNGLHLQLGDETTLELNSTKIFPGKQLPIKLSVMDKDSADVNSISVELNDPLHFFSVRRPVVFNNAYGTETFIGAEVYASKRRLEFDGPMYNFSVIFTDQTLISGAPNQVVFHIKVYNRSLMLDPTVNELSKFEPIVNISRLARQHARVTQPTDFESMKENYEGSTFYLLSKNQSPEKNIFGITSKTGIVYIKDERAFAKSSATRYRLKLQWKFNNLINRSYTIVVNVIDVNETAPPQKLTMCARQSNETSCERKSGSGSASGWCKWRSHGPANLQIENYATCSPDLNTCPDEHCDELESMDGSICPQDCATNINGEVIPSLSGKGIAFAAAPCSCSSPNSCVCIRDFPSINSQKKLGSRNRKRGPTREDDSNGSDVQKTSLPNHVLRRNDLEACGAGCVAMIGVVSIVVVSLILVALLAIIRQVKNSHSDKHRHVANRVPLTTVVSDYVDDRTVANDTPTTSNVGNNTITETKPLVEPKWEFRRDRLILQETLGEGEFGKVYKAQAWNIAQRPGYTTVAVKTLKENSTSSEEQDLLSELNLMREVSHPNVIKLLGACTTKGGPLYIIVEYAELGSLRAYLRKLRSVQNTVNTCVTNPSYFSSSEEFPSYSELTIKQELLSFAWQIAKGMAYLSDMKLVHRDLAARNILVDHGKVIKISDFGLSRDVYEGDTYLKTTKGRVPIKWMAIESLEDHVYTIKSDVWSYGIVLWELITLGASPYPGFTPERLFQLLKRGYRMPQPEGCPDKLYKLMRICWRDVPHERPSFKELVEKLDQLLQDTVEYMPLGHGSLSASASSSYLRPNTPVCETTPKSERVKEIDNTVVPNNKIAKSHKPPILHFAHATENGYESRLLLPSSPVDATSGDASV